MHILNYFLGSESSKLYRKGRKMIEFDGVSKSYTGVKALDDVSFIIPNGEIVGLVGANGAGKTTTIKLVMNHISPDAGRVLMDGQEMRKIRDNKMQIAYVPDEPVCYDFMSVEEHFKFIQSMYSNGEYGMDELIRRFDMESNLQKLPMALSKGNKQKLMLCNVLLRDFRYLIADEPFTGLDPKQIHTLKQIFQELRDNGKSIVLSTHLLDTIELFCDRYIMIEKGKIIASGTKQEILQSFGFDSDMSIEEAYIELTGCSEEMVRGKDDEDVD